MSAHNEPVLAGVHGSSGRDIGQTEVSSRRSLSGVDEFDEDLLCLANPALAKQQFTLHHLEARIRRLGLQSLHECFASVANFVLLQIEANDSGISIGGLRV